VSGSPSRSANLYLHGASCELKDPFDEWTLDESPLPSDMLFRDASEARTADVGVQKALDLKLKRTT
jgi:hypothetical protein